VNYHLDLTEQEFQALTGLLDAGVRATGLRAVKDAVALLAKLEAAAQAAGNEKSRSELS